jgi:SAM-dependent methyltransferase
MSATGVDRARRVVPFGGLLALSDLAREGIANQGSYRFADHLYKGAPSGRFFIGYCMDSVFLRLPAASAFRRRYLKARDAIANGVRERASLGKVRVLTIPCGIPRDAVEMAELLTRDAPSLLDRVEYVGMDIDPEALRVAAQFTEGRALRSPVFHRGDALVRDEYPAGRFHVVSSTGLTEFLDDDRVEQLFRNVYAVLEPGGTFYTSASARDPLSALLLRIIDLPTQYRSKQQLESILGRLPWRQITYTVDPSGFQTFVTAEK